MHVIKIGLDFRIAPLEVRERITFSCDEMKEAMQLLNEKYHTLENVIISTCNRTEIYAVVENAYTGAASVQRFMLDWFDVEEEYFIQYFRNLEDNDAIESLFTLTAGLDSMVLGETQILGQVRSAFLTAQEAKTTGRLLNELFKRGITFAKRSHKETGIGEHAVSVSYIAVELSKEIFGDIQEKNVVVIGAGEMGELAVRNLQASGVKKITIINRTFETAVNIAEQFHIEALAWDQLVGGLRDADICISSTGSSEPILDQAILQKPLEKRKKERLCLIDIAVPRDVDPSVKELDRVCLYDVDDLQGVVDRNVQLRKEAARIIQSNVSTEISTYNEWVAMLETVPLIKALREKSSVIQETTLQSIYRKMPDLTEREMKVLQKHTSSIIHQILHEPIETVKDMGKKEGPKEDLQLFKHIFGLEVSE